MYIRTNMPMIRAMHLQQQTAASLTKVNEKLALGFRINRAGDDAASLALSENMRYRIRMLSQAERNAGEGMDLAKTADGALSEINSILQRATTLCQQAAGGTMNDQGRQAISHELNGLFAEIDRITAYTCFNEIPLFRRKVYERKDMADGPRFIYRESVEALAPGQLEEWGSIDFLSAGNFDLPPSVKAANKVFRLNDSIQDVKDLEGKGFQFQVKKNNNYIEHTVYFKYSNSEISRPPDVCTCVELDGCQTVDDALRKMMSAVYNNPYCISKKFQNFTYDPSSRTVAFNGQIANGSGIQHLSVDGHSEIHSYDIAKDFSAAEKEAPSNLLGSIDGQGPNNNGPYYSNYRTNVTGNYDAAATFATPDECAKFQNNMLNVGGTMISLSDITCTVGMTYGEFYQKLAEKIDSAAGLKAEYLSGSNTVAVSWENPDKTDKLLILETYPSDTIVETELASINSTTIPLNITKTVALDPNLEVYEAWEVVLPDTLPGVPFSLTAAPQWGHANKSYVFYDSSTFTIPSGNNVVQTPNEKSVELVDIKDKSIDEVQELLYEKIQNAYAKATYILSGNVTREGNKLTIIANQANTGLQVDKDITSQAQKITWTERKAIAHGYAAFTVDREYCRDVSADFSLGSAFDKTKLAGTGFTFTLEADEEYRIEFVDGPGKGLRPESENYDVVDISGFTSFDDLSNYLNSNLKYKNTIWVDQSDSGNVRLRCKSWQEAEERTYTFTPAYVADGFIPLEYLFEEEPVSSFDGMDQGFSQKELDFSSINENNLDSLVGKGFRVNCATCAGEYINVFFCWENTGGNLIPKSFEYNDASTGGVTRTIHNVVVELSKLQQGSGIVQNIVDQVQGQLNHYIEMKVDPDNSNILIAQERRRGYVIANGSLRLASVQNGMKANFRYTLNKIPVDYGPWVGTGTPP